MAGSHRNCSGQFAGVARVRPLPVFLAVLLAGCGPAAPSDNSKLATVDYWPEQQLLFLASPSAGAVDVMRVPSSPRQGSLDFVDRLTESTRNEVIRLAVDRVNGRLWVVDRRMLYIYEFRPRTPTIRLPFGSANDAPISDLAIDASGNGYVILGGGAAIYKVPSVDFKPEKWIETTYTSSNTSGVYSSRVIVTKDSRYLIFQSPKDGRLVRLDLASKQLTTIQRTTPIALDCGPFLWTDDWTGDSLDSVATDPFKRSLIWFHCHGRRKGEIKFDSLINRSVERYLDPRE